LIPACATLLERRGFILELLKFTFNAENFICIFSAIYSWNACHNPKSWKIYRLAASDLDLQCWA